MFFDKSFCFQETRLCHLKNTLSLVCQKKLHYVIVNIHMYYKGIIWIFNGNNETEENLENSICVLKTKQFFVSFFYSYQILHSVHCAKISFTTYNFRKYYNSIREYTTLNNIEVWLKMCIICLVFIDYYCFRNGIFKFKFGKVYNRCRNGVCHLFSLICQNFKN